MIRTMTRRNGPNTITTQMTASTRPFVSQARTSVAPWTVSPGRQASGVGLGVGVEVGVTVGVGLGVGVGISGFNWTLSTLWRGVREDYERCLSFIH